MKNTGNIALIVCVLIIAFMLADRLTRNTETKIGIVDLNKMVYDYKGMKEATKHYEVKVSKWNSESDSLQKKMAELYEEIRTDSLKKDFVKLKRDISLFTVYRQSYAEHAQKTEMLARDEDQKMTLGVLNQLNEYVKLYAIENGFQVIFYNQPQSPAIGYVSEKEDVTKSVLEFANTKYEGGSK